MGRLGDLLKISTDSYKRLEVVYSCKRQVVVKNNAGNYVVAFSDRDLNVNDVLFYATKSITGNIVLCNQLGKDYVVTIKMSLFYDSKERAIEAIKYNIIKVVRSYDKRVIVKNSKGEYAAVYSKNWRKLKVSDILLYTTMNVSLGVTLYCKRIWEEDTFDIKILSRWHKSIEEIKSLISNFKIKKRNKTITPYKKEEVEDKRNNEFTKEGKAKREKTKTEPSCVLKEQKIGNSYLVLIKYLCEYVVKWRDKDFHYSCKEDADTTFERIKAKAIAEDNKEKGNIKGARIINKVSTSIRAIPIPMGGQKRY